MQPADLFCLHHPLYFVYPVFHRVRWPHSSLGFHYYTTWVILSQSCVGTCDITSHHLLSSIILSAVCVCVFKLESVVMYLRTHIGLHNPRHIIINEGGEGWTQFIKVQNTTLLRFVKVHDISLSIKVLVPVGRAE